MENIILEEGFVCQSAETIYEVCESLGMNENAVLKMENQNFAGDYEDSGEAQVIRNLECFQEEGETVFEPYKDKENLYYRPDWSDLNMPEGRLERIAKIRRIALVHKAIRRSFPHDKVTSIKVDFQGRFTCWVNGKCEYGIMVDGSVCWFF